MIIKENFQNTFAIIHLSDLHIVSHKNNYSTSLHKMIDHIYEISRNIQQIIIVFTGDLVERGNFSNTEKTIYNFFTDLQNKLNSRIIDIIFTPGNHDKKRGTLLLKSLKDEGDESFWEKFKENEWKYFSDQFEDFIRITKNIRKNIFKFDDSFDETYGIHIAKVDRYNICFLCINSSWMCMDETDEGNLRIGRFQLDDLMSQYQSVKSNINLVIALMHHPTDWLTKEEQKYLNQYMTDEYRLNTNIMLQGHIHEKETYNWYNQNHSLTTLVTGMGWDQQKEIKDNGHRYSLYEINMESSIVRVNTFVSDINGKFNEDTAVYKDNNIIFPLFVHKYLEMNKLRFSGSEYPFFYPNYNISDNYGYISNGINSLSINMIGLIKDFQYERNCLNEFVNIIKNNFLISCKDGKSNWINLKKVLTNKKDEQIKLLNKLVTTSDKKFNDIIKRLSNIIDTESDSNKEASITDILNIFDDFCSKYINIDAKDKFYSLIGSLCLDLQKYIFRKDLFKNNTCLRIHFRLVNIKDDEIKYKKLFSHSIIKEENIKNLKPIQDSDLSDISYEGSMIEKSFKSGHSMLCSLNPSSNLHKSHNDWIDFMTVAPNQDYNIYKIDDEIKIPYLSFGISVNSIELQTYLRELTFVGFEKLLSNLLYNFFNNISFDLSTLLEKGRQIDGK